jgi:hypothetical protein
MIIDAAVDNNQVQVAIALPKKSRLTEKTLKFNGSFH